MRLESGIKGLLDFIQGNIKDPKKSFRKDAITDEINGIAIDTACPSDTGKWETGIKVKEWIIVEQYENKEDALKGHKKWVEAVKSGQRSFKDIDLWGLERKE